MGEARDDFTWLDGCPSTGDPSLDHWSVQSALDGMAHLQVRHYYTGERWVTRVGEKADCLFTW